MNLDVAVEKQFSSFYLNIRFNITGKRTGVFGPSGSGKSTLMYLLAGLHKPDKGRICMDEDVLVDSSKGVYMAPEKRRIGVVFQHAHLFPHMNVQKNLMYGYKRIHPSERKILPEVLIDVLSLSHLLERQVSRLSGGERQRVALGRTILACPRLILMDEPLTGLDRKLKYQIIPYLKRVVDEFDIPLIFISHSIREMRLMTDEVLVVASGKLENRFSSEALARENLVSGDQVYANMICLNDPKPQKDLWRYSWGDLELILTEPGKQGENLFELPSREITLFKRHPQASSIRNLIKCKVTDIIPIGNRVAVEMVCPGGSLICQVVPDAVTELEVVKGSEVVAGIKASAFQRLF